jgi:hypothetical protein
MSYDNMDHADWAQRNITAAKKTAKKQRSDNRKGYAAAPDELNAFQRQVMTILGVVGGGIYNAPIAWDAIVWMGGRGMIVPWRNDLSTFDFQNLTALVFLCHMARIRCCVSPHGPGMLGLMFHPREAEGGMSQRHPDLDEAYAAYNARFPADHSIRYGNDSAAVVEEAING